MTDRPKRGRPGHMIPLIRELMADERARTITEIHEALGMRYSCRTKQVVDRFVDEGYLENLGTFTLSQFSRATKFRLAGPKPVATFEHAVTDNPFLWQTYQPYVPESHAQT